MKKKTSFFPYYFLVFMSLAGCASDENFTGTQANNQWQLSGKIGLVYPETNCTGEDCRMQSDQGSIKWQQQSQTYAIQLSDPFGRVVMTIDGDTQKLTAASPNQAPIQTTPNAFVALIANNSDNPALSTLSPADLSYWVTGRPSPNRKFIEQSSNQFVQNGYQITTKQWRATPAGKMPSLIMVTKDKFKLRLVVREWMTVQ